MVAVGANSCCKVFSYNVRHVAVAFESINRRHDISSINAADKNK